VSVANQNERVVMQRIDEWSNDFSSGFDGVWHGYPKLSEETGLSIQKLKKICRELRNRGKIELKQTYDIDGKLHGSGYFISA